MQDFFRIIFTYKARIGIDIFKYNCLKENQNSYNIFV